MDRDLLALIGMIICLVFILLAFFTPWYDSLIEGDYEYIGETKSESTLYLTKMIVKSKGMGESEKNTYENYIKDDEEAPYKYIFDITLFLMIGIFITSIIALMCVILVNFSRQKIETKVRKFAVIFCIISFILAILAPIYFMVALPSEMEKAGAESASFWYSETKENSTTLMNPGYAWYFIVIAAIITLISSILIFKKPKFKGVPYSEKI